MDLTEATEHTPREREREGDVCTASLEAQTVKNLPARQETRVPSLGQEDPLEKGMATHSTMLAWRIPYTKELGKLQSMGYRELDMTERLTFSLFLS